MNIVRKEVETTCASKLAFLSLIKYLTMSVCSHKMARINGVGPLIDVIFGFREGVITLVGDKGNNYGLKKKWGHTNLSIS